MIICDGLNELNNDVFTRVAIGKFDGIHLGHRKLIKEMTGKHDGLKSLVFTFSLSSPVSFNRDGYIYSEEERRRIFEDLGADYLVEYYLDEKAASVDPEEFVREVLVHRLHAKEVYCGSDLSFGYKGRGNVDTLKRLSDELDINLFVIEKEKYMGSDISSTRIRQAIKDGDTNNADAMLGRKA